MKVSMALADAANQGPGGKMNVLGLGVSTIGVADFPALVPLVVIGFAEVASDEVGTHPVKVTIETPGRQRTIFQDSIAISANPEEASELPIEAKLRIGFPLVAEEPGKYRIRLSLGRARAHRDVLVRRLPQASVRA